MNGTRASAAQLAAGIARSLVSSPHPEVALLPPFVFIPLMAEALRPAGGRIVYGGQNLDPRPGGAYTGEISGAMLRDFGCTYVIVGHSERRTLFGETDTTVAEKFAAAQAAGLRPILCLGETLAEREAAQTDTVMTRQLDAVLSLSGAAGLASAVIAYEPVWAIGTGRTATPQQAQAVHRFLRDKIAALDSRVAAEVRILYGGSVKASNAAELFAQPDIDGGLIGGASLHVDEFVSICRAAA